MVKYRKWGVNVNNQQESNVKSNNKLEKLIIILSVLLVIFGILTVFLLVKMYKMDNTLNRLSYIISSEISEYENKDIVDIFTEETEVPESNLPIYDEIYSEETTTSTNINTNNNSNTATHKTEVTSTQNTNATEIETTTSSTDNEGKITYVININSKKIHYAQCSFVNRMKEENKQTIKLSKNELKNYLKNGYTFCSTCGG